MMIVKYFSSPWCGPCKMFGPIFDKVIIETGVDYSKINIDIDPNEAVEYGVRSIPTLIIERDKVVVFRHTGVMSYNQLKSTILQHLGQDDRDSHTIFIV